MTWTPGYTPWNKGQTKPLTKCPRHRILRIRTRLGSTYCPECHKEANRAWALANRDLVRKYKKKHLARTRRPS